jgi:hypothetical protein
MGGFGGFGLIAPVLDGIAKDNRQPPQSLSSKLASIGVYPLSRIGGNTRREIHQYIRKEMVLHRRGCIRSRRGVFAQPRRIFRWQLEARLSLGYHPLYRSHTLSLLLNFTYEDEIYSHWVYVSVRDSSLAFHCYYGECLRYIYGPRMEVVLLDSPYQ